MILAVGVIAGGRIGFVFFPTPESQVLYANAAFAAGTPREHTAAFLSELEAALLEAERDLGGDIVQTAVSRLGGAIGAEGAGSARGDQLASMMVELVPSERREV